MRDTFINPFTDFGFKKLFGEEPNKDLLISFLNTLLPARHQIADLQYSRGEYQGASALDRKAIFDLNCQSSTGERFIVELQKAKQNFFKDRSVYYATFPIQEQALQGNWDFRLSAVYTIGILDFVFDEDAKAGDKEVVHRVELKNQHGQVFYDKLTFIYLTLPCFTKGLGELQGMQEQWFYLFKHLHEFNDIPAEFRGGIFEKVFQVAQLAKFSPPERQAYRDSLKYYWDLNNVTCSAREEGRAEGLAAGLATGREQGRADGRADMLIDVLASRFGGLSPEQTARLCAMDTAQLAQCLKNIWDARSLEDFFGQIG